MDSIRIYDSQTLKLIKEKKNIGCCHKYVSEKRSSVSSNNTLVAYQDVDKNNIRIFDIKSDIVTDIMHNSTISEKIESIIFSFDNKRVIVGYNGYVIRIFDVETKNMIKIIKPKVLRGSTIFGFAIPNNIEKMDDTLKKEIGEFEQSVLSRKPVGDDWCAINYIEDNLVFTGNISDVIKVDVLKKSIEKWLDKTVGCKYALNTVVENYLKQGEFYEEIKKKIRCYKFV